MTDVNANIIVNIDSSAALVNLRRLETQIDQFQRRAAASGTAAAASQRDLNKQLLDGINNTGLFSAKTVMAQDSMARLSDSIDKGKLSLGEYTRYAASQLPGLSRTFKREFDLMGQVAESRVKKMHTQYIALGRTVDGVTKAIAATPTGLAQGYATDVALATQRQQLFNKMIDDGSTKLLNWGKNTQWAGRQLMVGFSIPMAALGAAAAKTFMEIDKATVSLKRVYGDLNTTTQELESNVEAVKSLGKQYTKYGIAVSETVNISARAAATGATNEKLMAATEQTLRFATLGQMDYNQALDTTISLQTAFGTSNEDLGKKIDYLNAVENQTVLTMEDMSLAIPRVATVVKGLGGDVEDLAVMMTAMKEGGISAENAANGLKSGLASLINPTKRATESLAGMGINIKSIIEANKGDLMGLVTDFGSAINSLDQFSRQQALEKVFGKFQFARMSALFTNITSSAGQAARAMDIAKMSAEDLASMSEKELGKISESTSVKFQAAMENLKNSVAPIGEAFLKGLTPVINVVSKIADAFNNLPGGIKNTVAVITALLAGIAPVALMGIGLLANGFANLVKTVQFFRKTIARIKGDGDAFKWFTASEREALSATEALEGSTQSLTGKLLLQRGAVEALTNEYGRFAQVAGIANVAMGRMGGGGARNAGAGQRPPLRMATGGTVPGTGNKDTIPALLTPGESVITKKATQKYGPILQQMNDGTLPGFNKGTILSNLFRAGANLVGGARFSPKRSARQAYEDGAKPYYTISRRSGSGWSDLPEESRTVLGEVIGHIHTRAFDRRFGGQTRGVAAGSFPGIHRLRDRPGGYDILPNQYVVFPQRINDSLRDSSLTSAKWVPRSGRHMLSVYDFLESNGVSREVATRVAERAAEILNERMSRVRRSVGEYDFGGIVTGSTSKALKEFESEIVYGGFNPMMLAGGGVSIAQSLKSWQTSSRSVRENPEMLAALMGGMKPLGKKQSLTRGTTLGLGRGSEFAATDEKMIFDAIKSGRIRDLVGRDVSMGGPISYTGGGSDIAHRAMSQNADVNRIEFLKAQHALGRRKHKEDLAAIARLEANIARGTGPIDLYTRQLAERKSRVAMYAEGQKALGREIKSLAPRGYRHLEVQQGFRPEDYGVSVSGGSYMGSPLDEREIISAGSRARIKNAYINDKGLPVIELENIGEVVVPGAVTRAMAGMIPKQSLSRKAKVDAIREASPIDKLMQYKNLKEQSLRSLFDLRFNDVPGAGSPRDFLGHMFDRWERVPTRPSPKEDMYLAKKKGKLKYPPIPQDEYLADMILASTRFDAPDTFKPVKLGEDTFVGGKRKTSVYDGHTRIHALTVKGLIQRVLGKNPESMSKQELIEAIHEIKTMTASGQITNKEVLSATSGQRILTASASDKEIMALSDHPLRRKQMQSMHNSDARKLIPGVHDKELGAIVAAAKKANFYGIGTDDDSLIKAMGFSRIESGAYMYNPSFGGRDRKSYVENTSRRILEGMIDRGEILPLNRNKGGMISPLINGKDPMVGRFANGLVPGVGNTDKIPALLTPGESVITKEATAKYAPILHQMNNGTLPGFAQGDEDIQSSRRGRAPGNIQRQGVGMTWETMEEEKQILGEYGRSTLGANAHIVPRPSLPVGIEWNPRAIQRDLQEVNDFVDKSKDFAASTLDNQEHIDEIVKNTGLTQEKVKNQLTDFSEGVHATTRESGLVLKEIARLRGDVAIERVMQTRLAGNYYETISQRSYAERGVPVAPWTVAEARAKQTIPGIAQASAGRGQESVEDIYRRLRAKNPTMKAQDALDKARRLELIREARELKKRWGMSNQEALAAARSSRAAAEEERRNSISTGSVSDDELRRRIRERRGSRELRARQRRFRQSGRGSGRGPMVGAAGILGATSMIPFMMQDQQGQFMGMNANMLGMGMTGASVAASMMTPKMLKGGLGLGKLAGGIATRTGIGVAASGAGALGGAATAGMVAATGGAAAGLLALGVTAWALKKGMENTLDAGIKYADALTVSTKEQQNIAQLFGRTILEERRLQKARSKSLNLTTQEQKMGAEFVATEPGQVMLDQIKLLESKGADIASTVGAQLSRMVISGAVNKKQAKAIAVGLADALGKPDMAIPISLKVANIVGPDGTSLTNKPTKIIENLKKSFEQSERTLSASVNAAMQKNEQSWMGGSGFLGLSGDFDAMAEAQIAYTNTYLENTKQIISAIDDQITREEILIQKLKDKQKAAKTPEEKKKIAGQIKSAEAEKKALEDQRKDEESTRRKTSTNILYGQETGRAERFTGMLSDIETGSGVYGLESAIQSLTNKKIAVPGGSNKVLNPNAGSVFTQEEKDKLKASIIVDVKLGKVDPNSLAALDALSGKNKNKIMPIALNLYQQGDFEGFNSLAGVGGLDPNVQDSFVKLLDKIDMSDKQAVELSSTLSKLGDVSSQNTLLSWLDDGTIKINGFYKTAQKLQGLNIDIASLISGGNGKALAMASLSIDKVNLSINKFKKEASEINKLKGSERISKQIELASKIVTANGKSLTPEQLKNQIPTLLEKTGLNEKQVYNLPPVEFNATIQMILNAKQMRETGNRLLSSAATMDPSSAATAAVRKEADSFLRAAAALEGASTQVVANSTAGGGDGKKIPDGLDDGGGGSKTNYVKDMMKGFLDQARMYANAGITMKQLTNSKYKFGKELLASGKANKGIIEQLRSMGLSENIIANLMSQGPEAVTQALKTYKKGGKAAVQKANVAEFRGTMSGLIGGASEGLKLERRRTAAANTLRTKFNASPEIIQTAMQDDAFTNIITKNYKSVKERNAAIAEYIRLLKEQEKQTKATATATDPASSVEESFGKYASVVDSAFAAEGWRIKTAAAEKFAKANGMTIEAMQRQITLNERLIRLEQEKIDKKQSEINGIQHSNDLIQQSIDKKRRDDEIAQRSAEALSHELDIMSQQEQKIRDAYDEKIKALDKVASINQHLIDQQKQQLGLADALSRGDIAAAAMAQQEMQASDAQYAVDQVRSGLQTGMENQIAGLTTQGGLTRAQAEAEIAKSKENSYQVGLLIRDQEDAMYANNILIRDLNNQIYDIQNGQLKTLNETNTAYQTKLSDYETELDYQILTSAAAGYTKESWEKAKESSTAMIDYLKSNQTALTAARQEWERIRIAAEGAAAASGGQAAFTASATPGTTLSSSAYTNPVSVSGGQKYGGQIHYRGGLIKKYATGSFIYGDGGRDSVSARLTPGEYVMRKSAVSKYGQTIFEKMNMGAFSMPTYDLGVPESTPVQNSTGVSNISAPVYNNYSVNVNVPNTNANPDEIANKVMMRITQIDSANVRSLGGNK